jgi:hypothetical protein
MTADPRAGIRAALDGDGPAAAFTVLRHSLAWAVEVMQATTGRPDGLPVDTVALDLLIRLDDALLDVHDLGTQSALTADVALAGRAVNERILGAVGELRVVADDVTSLRHRSEALGRVESELAAARLEHEELTERVADLERMERLAGGLPALHEQRAALVRRLAAMAAPVAEAEQALLDTAGQVVALGEELREHLSKRTRDMLAQLEAVEQARVSEVREQAVLAGKTAAYAQLKEERDRRLRALGEYRRIDAELQQRLVAAAEGRSVEPTARGLGGLLDGVEATLREIDDGLRTALERYDRLVAEDLQELPWRHDDPA